MTKGCKKEKEEQLEVTVIIQNEKKNVFTI